jgi:hypothetical protein
MRLAEKLRLLGCATIVLTCGLSAYAESLSGTVVDPQQRVIAGAEVSLNCGKQIETRKTDGGGSFSFTRPAIPEDCMIQAVYPGFAVLELTVGRSRDFTLQLRLAELKQTVVAKDDRLSPAPVASVSLSANDLRNISDNSADLVAYAKNLAGIYSGSDHIYVDGLPADHPPPADRIESITINADPFTAEYSDGGETHIDIATTDPERKFRLSSSGVSLGTKAPDGLNSRLTSTSSTATLGLIGPVPYFPLAFTSNFHFTDGRKEQPIEAVVPPLPGISITSVDAATTKDWNALWGLGADYSKKETLRVNASVYAFTARDSNVNVSGLTLPEAGLSHDMAAREFRATFAKVGMKYVYRGGITTDWSTSDLNANSSALGVSVSGAFVGGGADVSSQDGRWMRWTLKNVLQFNEYNRNWSAGAMVSRRGDAEDIIPNPFGHIYFDNLEDYTLSATNNADLGTGIITRGSGRVRYASYTAAPFVEAEILRRARVVVRGGLRSDAQTAGGLLFSPRLSAVALLRGYVLRAGSGLFVQNWANDIFLRVLENDGNHLQRFLITNAPLSALVAGTTTPQTEIASSIAPDLTPTHNWVSKLSLEHPFRRLSPGLEYTWTDGTHLLGSQRLPAPTGWKDVLESNRDLLKHQLHFRAQYRIRSQSLAAHYEWIHARDNTDGPFSFPAQQDDIRAEWGPASGMAPHNLSGVANLKFGKALSLVLVDGWHSPLPLNITSGLDPEDNGLYTDRGGRTRNSGLGPYSNSMQLLAHRRIAVPKLFSGTRERVYADLGLQALNLLGDKDYVSMGTVIGSPLFAKPLAAAPGRSVRFSFNFSR